MYANQINPRPPRRPANPLPTAVVAKTAPTRRQPWRACRNATPKPSAAAQGQQKKVQKRWVTIDQIPAASPMSRSGCHNDNTQPKKVQLRRATIDQQLPLLQIPQQPRHQLSQLPVTPSLLANWRSKCFGDARAPPPDKLQPPQHQFSHLMTPLSASSAGYGGARPRPRRTQKPQQIETSRAVIDNCQLFPPTTLSFENLRAEYFRHPPSYTHQPPQNIQRRWAIDNMIPITQKSYYRGERFHINGFDGGSADAKNQSEGAIGNVKGRYKRITNIDGLIEEVEEVVGG